MMKLFRLSRFPVTVERAHASWTTRGDFSMGSFVAEYFGRPVVSVSRKRNIWVNPRVIEPVALLSGNDYE
jgi:hypothetical protein